MYGAVPGTIYFRTFSAINGIGTNFGMGYRRGEAQRAESGDGVPGEGAASPSHQLGVCERCKLPQRGRGAAPAAEGFSYILSHQIAFPSISVRVAYSLHG